MIRVLFIFCLVVSAHFLKCLAQVPITLSDALHQANNHNPKLKSERLNVPIAESDYRKSKLHQNPIFNVQYMQLLPSSSSYTPNMGLLNAYNSQDWFQLTKKFQVFGQRQNKIELAKLNVKLSENSFLETKRSVLYDVSIKWIEAWRALAHKNMSVKAAEYLDDYYEENFDSVKGKSQMTEDEKLRFKILDNQYDIERERAEQDYFTVVEELKLLMGNNKSIGIDLNDTTEFVKITANIDSLYSLARENRNDLKNFRAMKEFSTINQRYQKSLSVPQPEAGLLWNPQNRIPYAGVYFTQVLPFFDRNQTEVQKAKLQTDMSSVVLERNLTILETEIMVAYSNYKKYKEMAFKYKANVNDAEKLLRMVRLAYLLRKHSTVDLWESEQTWIRSNILYYDAFADYRKSYVTLLYQLNLLGETQ